jgi:hypothetical protein
MNSCSDPGTSSYSANRQRSSSSISMVTSRDHLSLVLKASAAIARPGLNTIAGKFDAQRRMRYFLPSQTPHRQDTPTAVYSRCPIFTPPRTWRRMASSMGASDAEAVPSTSLRRLMISNRLASEVESLMDLGSLSVPSRTRSDVDRYLHPALLRMAKNPFGQRWSQV